MAGMGFLDPGTKRGVTDCADGWRTDGAADFHPRVGSDLGGGCRRLHRDDGAERLRAATSTTPTARCRSRARAACICLRARRRSASTPRPSAVPSGGGLPVPPLGLTIVPPEGIPEPAGHRKLGHHNHRQQRRPHPGLGGADPGRGHLRHHHRRQGQRLHQPATGVRARLLVRLAGVGVRRPVRHRPARADGVDPLGGGVTAAPASKRSTSGPGPSGIRTRRPKTVSGSNS